MQHDNWRGVFAALTTPFLADGAIDHQTLAAHASWLVESGCRGVVALGSLGEGGTLEPQEKIELLRGLVSAVGGRVPVVAGIGALSTSGAVALARAAERAGCRGLMVLPPYAYRGSWAETRTHFEAVINATGCSCMIYNNPIAYGTDTLPEQVAELARICPTLHAVKESSADVRRVTALRALVHESVAILVGVDDLIVEGIGAGATGWVAGLVNAFPRESVELFERAMASRHTEARALYDWFLPLLRMDVVPEFVHLIKLVQQETHAGKFGNDRLRPPRLALEGAARSKALSVLRDALSRRPSL